MAIKVKAMERQLKVGKEAGKFRYIMQAEIYNTLDTQKVIHEAAVRSGIAEGALSAAWDAIGEVVKAWATEGHSIAIPGLGRMRFGVRATSVEDVNKVSSTLITTRRVIFSPNVDIKTELQNTSINITCYDRDGNIVKRVKSSDPGTVEDPEDPDTPSDDGGSTGGNTGGSTGGNSGSNTGGNSGGGNNGDYPGEGD